MHDDNTIARMRALYAGLDRAYGRYTEAKSGERKGKGSTVTSPVTDDIWRGHLAGHQRIGIIPIRDGNTCVFGAIDIDDYDIGVTTIAARAAGLPLIITRTKSAGAHCWLFLDKPTQASKVREYLTQAAVFLGYPGAEVFPKQIALASKEDVGNWIHVPYFDADRSLCHGVTATGDPIKIAEWLDIAEQGKVDPDTLGPIHIDDHELLAGAPPCLQTFARNGVPDGQRNNVLFAMGVYCKKAHDPGWEDELAKLNQSYMSPPLAFGEVEDTIKALRKKTYFYPCNKAPLSSVCNKSICRTVEHGIGGTPTDPGVQIESITKVDSDPPFYFVQVNGHRIEVQDSRALLNQGVFRQLVFEKLDVIPSLIKEAAWAGLINALMADAHHIEAPADASAYGQFEEHLITFLVGRAMAKDKDEIILGRPWKDPDGIVWFRYTDFGTYLDRRKFRDYNSTKIYAVMKQNLKCKHAFWRLKGGGVNVWGLDPNVISPQPPTEPFDVPEFEQGEDPFTAPMDDMTPPWEDYDLGGIH